MILRKRTIWLWRRKKGKAANFHRGYGNQAMVEVNRTMDMLRGVI